MLTLLKQDDRADNSRNRHQAVVVGKVAELSRNLIAALETPTRSFGKKTSWAAQTLNL